MEGGGGARVPVTFPRFVILRLQQVSKTTRLLSTPTLTQCDPIPTSICFLTKRAAPDIIVILTDLLPLLVCGPIMNEEKKNRR